MASTPDLPPPAGASSAEATTLAASIAPEPAPPPPPPSSKRRWSPCTWRYAIEDSQPELGSRQRLYSSAASSALRSASDHPAAPVSSFKSRPPNHHQDHTYGKEPEEPRRSSYAHRGTDLTEPRSKHSRSHEMSNNKKKRSSPPNDVQPSHHFFSTKKHSPKEEGEDNEAETEEDEVGADDADLGHHAEEGKERRKRKMSPSEIYFCEICRSKAESAKSSSSDNRNIPSHGP